MSLGNGPPQIGEAITLLLEGWGRAADLDGNGTSFTGLGQGVGSQRDIGEVTVRVARELGVDESELVHVRRGALLHDIGKIGVPRQILTKVGLTDDEWVVIRQHPRIAYEMMNVLPELRPAAEIPYCHHERWDGSGYPRGLRGEEIPLAARVFAVVDAWDAMLSERPFRAAFSSEETLLRLRQQVGRQFDARVVEAFLEVESNPH
jgi:HD-GYP domain-containing protein (c-di-GMP phosphodiesterase class II)